MKKILIFGDKSYIGTSFMRYIQNNTLDYSLDVIDSMGNSWMKKDFSIYDSVFHVAGIAHSDTRKLTKEQEDKYYMVNTDLPIAVAKKAKEDKAKQFIFMSSMLVFGESAYIGKDKNINSKTKIQPSNIYGLSKVRAEEGLSLLNSQDFKVCILRPPLIYGKRCKGNFPVLEKYALKLPVFPNIQNSRSMIYIDNFCEFIKLMIDNNESGIFHPQNDEYIITSHMVKVISELNGKDIKLTKVFNPVLYLLGKNIPVINKVFGNMTYDKSLSDYKQEYALIDFYESIRRLYSKD